MRLVLAFLACALCAAVLTAQGTTTIAAVFPPPQSAQIVGGTTDHAVLAFTVQRVQPNPPPATLIAVAPSMTGTATALDLVQWRLYQDVNSNGAYDAGTDTQVGAASNTLAPVFNGFTLSVPSSAPLALFITVDVAAAASTGATFTLQLLATQITTAGGGRSGGPINSNAATIDNSANPPVMSLTRTGAIASGGSDALGNVLLAGANFDYDVLNSGTSNLVLTGSPAVVVSNTSNCSVAITQPGAAVIAPSGQTAFSLQVTPLTAAAFSFDVSIANNDPGSGQNPYTFSASGTGMTPNATELVITQQPAGSTGGLALGTQPIVEARNGLGGLDTTFTGLVTAAITTGSGTTGASLLGTVTLAAAGGIATFTDLAIDLAGTGYTLTFSSTTLTPDVSGTFDITVGAATQLVILVQPADSTGGVALPTQPEVAVQDAGGNTLGGDNTTQVSVAIRSGTGTTGANLIGTTTLTVNSGLADFAGLAIDLAGAGYELEFTASGLASAISFPLTISIGPAAGLIITTQPGNGDAGAALFVQPVLELRDAGGNVLSGDNSSQVSAAITSGTGTSGANLQGTTTLTVAAGVATFTDLAIDLAGTGYTLTFTSGALTPQVSNTLTIAAGVAAQLSVLTQPGNGTGGLDLSTQPVVALQDSLGNTLTADNTSQVSVAIRAGTGTTGASLLGTTTVTVSGGIATFAGLAIDLAGTGYELEFTSAGVPDEFSNSFDVTIGAADSLAITVQPGNGAAGQSLASQPVVELRDAGGNVLVADNTTQVSAAITAGTGTSGANLLGTTTITVVAGEAAFTDLGVDLAGTGYTLTFSSGALSDEISAAFQVAAAGAAQLTILTQPGNGMGGLALSPQPVVAIQDALGNTLTADNTSQVTASITAATGTAGAALLGTATVTVSGGLASFAGLAIDLAGTGYELTFSSTGLPDEGSASFNVTVGVAAQLRIAQQPSGASAGVAFTTQPVIEIVDAGGNVITSDSTTSVQVALLTAPAGMTLGGTTTVVAVSGVCAFTDLSASIGGGPVTLRFADTGASLTAVDAAPFSVAGGSSGGGGKKKGGDEGCSTGEQQGGMLLLGLVLAALVLANRRKRAAQR